VDDAFLQMLRDWQTYYFILATAAATLVGLMFIAASLGARLVTADTVAMVHTWVTPTILHFGSALFISALITLPTLTSTSFVVFLGIAGVAGLVYDAMVGIGMWRQTASNPLPLNDWLWYVGAPAVSYGLVVITAVGLPGSDSQFLNALALGVALLVASGIRNAWDLMLWIAQQREDT
jgi:hypothetical protein